MSDIEEKLRQLEETLKDTETALHQEKATMSGSKDKTDGSDAEQSCFPYTYVIGGLIPLLTLAGLYFSEPKFVTKKVKGKQVVCMKKLFMYTGIITAVGLVIMYIINCAMNGSLSSAMACFGNNN